MNNKTKYYSACITAYAIWGFFSLVLKPLHAYAALDILFYRIFICTIIMLLIVVMAKRAAVKEAVQHFKSRPKAEQQKFLLINIAGGTLLTANWLSFIYVLNNVSIKATSLAYMVCPILTTLLAYFILKEKLTGQQWVSIILSVLGCSLLAFNHLTDIAFSIIIGLSYAVYLITQRVNRGFDKFLTLTIHFMVASIVLLPFYPAYSAAVPVSSLFWILISVIAVFFTIIPLFLNLYALKGLNSSTTGMLLNINPVIAFALAIGVYHEKIDGLQIVAYATIFMAVILFNVKGSKQK